MTFDTKKNFAYSTVKTAPSSEGTSLIVQTDQGSRFAAGMNATVWPTNSIATPDNATIIRITAVEGDTITFQRQQEGSSDRTIIAGDQISGSITVKTITDLEDAIALLQSSSGWGGYIESADDTASTLDPADYNPGTHLVNTTVDYVWINIGSERWLLLNGGDINVLTDLLSETGLQLLTENGLPIQIN